MESPGQERAAAPANVTAVAPATLAAALRDYRDFSAMSGDVLVGMIPGRARAAATRALNLDMTSAAWAWSLFFKGALWIPAHPSDEGALAAYYNPAFDVVLLTRWRLVDGVWSIVSLEPRTGASLRHEADATAPTWVVTRAAAISEGLIAQHLPTADQIEALRSTPPTGRAAMLPLARIMVMRREAARLYQANSSVMQSVLSVIESGDASQLRKSGSGKTDAKAIARLPRAFRSDLVVFGAIPEASGEVLIVGPEHRPGLIYLIAINKGGAVAGITAVAELGFPPAVETHSERGAS
jgi:hypothetical protein